MQVLNIKYVRHVPLSYGEGYTV